ncbi:hypothetical protein [Aliarcobacter cryaerophilus]|uniref:Uncharacterized protein n=1 Tax=Aliarcobacter cryaerophilus TaxID=28198 RepID=A0AA46S1H5_9BACT|nr:hypothetical protein [Aliarcobacter cryaerophilus]UYF43444.1 hypothetical protein NGX11_00525 [Aliarcobacter cryaerophilus]
MSLDICNSFFYYLQSFVTLVLISFILLIFIKYLTNKYLDNEATKSDITIQIISFISYIWFLFIIILWFNDNETTELNNWGDYLAGFFAPLLFMWVIFGIYLQKKEFTNAINEYKKSVRFLEKQSVNADVQHQNVWFDRNVDMLEKYIDNVIKNTNAQFEEINMNFIAKNVGNYRKIVQEIKNIVDLEMYINETLINARRNDSIELNNNETEDIKIFNLAIEKLLQEFNILFGKNCKSSQEIVLKIYLQIYASIKITEMQNTEEDVKELLKQYYELKNWLNKEKIELIESIMKEYEISLELSFIDDIFDKVSIENKNFIIY